MMPWDIGPEDEQLLQVKTHSSKSNRDLTNLARHLDLDDWIQTLLRLVQTPEFSANVLVRLHLPVLDCKTQTNPNHLKFQC